jgi:integrase
MPIYRDKAKGCFVFEFDRRINRQRIRARQNLPKAWNRAQADAFDRQETAKLYAHATGVERPEFTIEEAVACYLTERVSLLKSGDNIEAELSRMFYAYQGRPLSMLADVCKAYQIGEKDKLSPATIRNRIRYLTSACRYAWKHGSMGDRDPAERVTVPVVRNERSYFIDRGEMLRLCSHCSSLRTRAIIRIAFYSGMRLGEILQAKRENGHFVLTDTKNGDQRRIPIHPKIVSAKVDLSYGQIEKNFREARRLAGMEWLRFHDLRHSAASAMINQGVDLYTVGAVLGHRSATSTKRYSHLATERLAEAVFRIGKKVA